MVPFRCSAGRILFEADEGKAETFDVVVDGFVGEVEGWGEGDFFLEASGESLLLFHKL